MRTFSVLLCASVMFLTGGGLFSQQLQVPPTIVPNETAIKAGGTVTIVSRKDIQHSGKFKFSVGGSYNPVTDAYPSGTVKLSIDLSDTQLNGIVTVSVPNLGIMQLTSIGKHTPTVFLYARCDYGENAKGYLWMMLVDNKKPEDAKTSDIVQFVLLDKFGKRIAYGCGPVDAGGDVHAVSGN
jgi:hypothetical protein